MEIQTKRYEVKNKALQNIIDFYWQIDSNIDAIVNHKLLPIKNTDLVLNFSSPIEYIINGEVVLSSNLHFSAIKNQSYTIRQNGKINVFGISFFPHGLYHILQKPMSLYNGKIVDIENLNLELTKCVQSHDFCNSSANKKIDFIENFLLNNIGINFVDKWTMNLLKSFYLVCSEMKITDFCLIHKISTKQFERIFLRIVGVAPKQFQSLSRYQNAVNSIIYDENKRNLSELANSLNYYDQTHFNKEFMKYSGYNPTTFKRNKLSVKQNSELI